MSDSKDDIKWRFQILYDLISTAVDQQGRERDRTKNDRIEFENFMIRTRNELLAGIGVIISIILALIAKGLLLNFYLLSLIILAVIGLGIFTIMTEVMYWKAKKFRKLDIEYADIIYDELLTFQSKVAAMAILKTMSNEQIISLTQFLSMLTFAQSYTIQVVGHKLLKSLKPDQEKYREYYHFAKSFIAEYEKSNLPFVIPPIEKFISNFENNEKKIGS